MIFLRNTVIALVILLVVGVVLQYQTPISQPVEEYVHYVLTTNFEYEPLAHHLQDLGATVTQWDVSSLLQGLPRISTGR